LVATSKWKNYSCAASDQVSEYRQAYAEAATQNPFCGVEDCLSPYGDVEGVVC
jgi:hypothetical protein